MKHQQFILAVSFAAVLSVGMIQACGYQSDTASVTINLGHQQQAALEKTSIFDRFLAFITLSTRLEAEPPAFPQSIYAILLSVSGPGMTGIERSFARSEIDNGRITLSVPAGDARTFAVVALVPGQFEYPSRTYGGISTVALAPGDQAISIQMGNLPFPPSGLSPSRTSNQQEVPFNYVSWDGADPGQVTGYHVYRAASETGTYVRIGTVTNPGPAASAYVEDYAINEQDIYWYKVSGYNVYGEGDTTSPLPDNW